MEKPKTPLLFIIMSGFGVYPEQDFYRYTPNLNKFIENYPATVVKAEDPKLGDIDSKSGHQIMGAGRSILPTKDRISSDIKDDTFSDKEQVQKIKRYLGSNGSSLHLFASADSSRLDHVVALTEAVDENTDVHMHLSVESDDLDTVETRQKIRTINKEAGSNVSITSIINQDYIQRTEDWGKLKDIVLTLTDKKNNTKTFTNLIKFTKKDSKFSIAFSKNQGVTIDQNDAIIFADYSGENLKYLAKAFSLPLFKFDRKASEFNVFTLVQYEKDILTNIIYSRNIFHDNLTEVLIKNGFLPYYITETIKNPYLNYYFKGNIVDRFTDEEVEVVSSPSVQSFSDRSAMASKEISRKLLQKLQQDEHDVYVAEFPNFEKMDSVEDKKKALKKLDGTVGKLVENVMVKGGVSIITSDYSQKINQDQQSDNIPFLVVSNEFRGISFPKAKVPNSDLTLASPTGSLKDITPTILNMLDVDIPEKMETKGFDLDFNISP